MNLFFNVAFDVALGFDFEDVMVRQRKCQKRRQVLGTKTTTFLGIARLIFVLGLAFEAVCIL